MHCLHTNAGESSKATQCPVGGSFLYINVGGSFLYINDIMAELLEHVHGEM